MSASLPAPAPTKSAISSATLPSGAPSFATVAAPTYCAVAARTPYITPRLKPVPLGSRPSTNVDNVPAILLTQAEEDQLRKQRENTLIMKFSAGHPALYEIRSHIHSEWKLDSPPAVKTIDKGRADG